MSVQLQQVKVTYRLNVEKFSYPVTEWLTVSNEWMPGQVEDALTKRWQVVKSNDTVTARVLQYHDVKTVTVGDNTIPMC